MGFPLCGLDWSLGSSFIFFLLFCLSRGAPHGEWVPARKAKGCFLRRCQRSRGIDFFEEPKRIARPQVEAEARRAAAHRNASHLAVSTRGAEKEKRTMAANGIQRDRDYAFVRMNTAMKKAARFLDRRFTWAGARTIHFTSYEDTSRMSV